VKIATSRIEAFLRKPEPAIRAVLLYGPDAGLVHERARALVAMIAGDVADPFRVAELTAAQLREDPARLQDEARAMSLTGGRRAVWVREAGDALADSLAALLGDAGGDSLTVVEAGELSPRSKLRLLFEAAENAAALPCYVDDGGALEDVIVATLAARGLAPSPDALAYLAASLGGDRMLVRAELEKLALYAAGAGEINLEDAAACVGDGAEVTLEDLAFAAGAGDQPALARAIARAEEEGASPITVLRAVARHFERLHLAAAMVETGLPADRAMKSLRPPVFFRREASFRAQLALWRTADLARAIESLTAAEVDCKTTAYPAATICARALAALASRAGRAPRSR
jgi:DNA polymerase-3 subunit delta